MFKAVNPKLDVVAMEEKILKFWTKREIFKKTVEQRQGKPEYVFYEGPPTANGKPGVHHVLARAFKDMFPRYKIMRGYHVSRRGGWDTHGLPVEIEVEKQLGFTNKQQIEDYGVDKFNELCRK
ncbi:MAG: class I tRNA ligase family protein, partial [Chloroflexi bacterium]|nr:class I tRNA ligase family protein [Chloroflexota bacterium]